MTDKEAFELLVKYGGGEWGLAKIRDMILVANVETAIKNTITILHKRHPNAPKDFDDWIRQAFTYVEKQMKQPLN